MVIFTARNDQGGLSLTGVLKTLPWAEPCIVMTHLPDADQLCAAVELVKPGKILALKGAKVDMFKGSLRLMVPNAGSIESLESSKLEPKVMPFCSKVASTCVGYACSPCRNQLSM